MSVLAIIGAQWGDEGKGKIVDELSMRADFVVRYQGGSNAGIAWSMKKVNSLFVSFPPGFSSLKRLA